MKQAEHAVLCRVLLQHLYFYITIFRDVSYLFSVNIESVNGNEPFSSFIYKSGPHRL